MRTFRLLVIIALAEMLFGRISPQAIAADTSKSMSADEIVKTADGIADAQLKALAGKSQSTWVWGVMQAGYADYSHLSPNGGKYADVLTDWADRAKWTPPTHKADLLHADDLCIGQTWLDLYAAHPSPSHIDPLKKRLDLLVEHIKAEPDEPAKLTWWWCDALFMCPPVLARMSAITGDSKYIDAMDLEYWRTVAALYDREEHLFYRDNRFMGKTDQNGIKILWSRGNGWVVAGLARVLQLMPADYPSRPKYVALFKEMVTKLASLQSADGTWHPSLLDPTLFDDPETSGTSLFAYGIAWGINNKLLDRDAYLPIVARAWSAMLADRRADGLPGYVEAVADQPRAVKADGTQLYTTGTMLLDAMEIQKLAPIELSKIPARKPATAAAVNTGPVQPEPGATAFARYVPERMDDIAWENDRIAHRIYGPALQNNPHEHSGSGIDVWVKSVRRLVINEWYKGGKYHVDHGTGLDFYEVGLSRGDGGLGIWDGGKLYSSKDWTKFKILDKGPSECGFDLTYDPWMVNGRRVWETRTMTLKAGSNLDRIESTIHSDQPGDLIVGIGLASREGNGGKLVQYKERGLMSYWQPPEKNGAIGVGVLVDPLMVVSFERDPLNYLVLLKVTPDKPFVYYAGACWDHGLDFKTADEWEKYLEDFKRE